MFKMSEKTMKISWNILGWILDALAAVALIFCIWCTKTIILIDKRVQRQEILYIQFEKNQAKTEVNQAKTDMILTDLVKWQAATKANRFTKDDGAKIWQEIAGIHKQIARQEVPQWLKDDLTKIENELIKLRGSN